MYRLEGISATLRELLRPWATEPASVVTLFGGATVLLFLLSLLYWVGNRRKVATVVSYAFVALTVVLILKTLLGLPRPPAEARVVELIDDPYGFPSGHAVAAVVVYGGLATVYERLDRWTVAAVSVVVAAIALSRVIIGVHYLGDVLAGIALGVALLAVLWKFVEDVPVQGFEVAAGCAIVAVALEAPESALALGGSIGGVVGTYKFKHIPEPRSVADRVLSAVVGLPLVVGVQELVGMADPFGLVFEVAGYAVLVVVILVVPVVVGKVPLHKVGLAPKPNASG